MLWKRWKSIGASILYMQNVLTIDRFTNYTYGHYNGKKFTLFIWLLVVHIIILKRLALNARAESSWNDSGGIKEMVERPKVINLKPISKGNNNTSNWAISHQPYEMSWMRLTHSSQDRRFQEKSEKKTICKKESNVEYISTIPKW